MASTHEAVDTVTSTVLTVQRGMQVLRAFHSDRRPMGNTELVRLTGLPKATVSRLTTTLLQRGYLRHAPGGRQFVLTAAPLTVGQAYAATSELVERAAPFLRALAQRLDLQATLAMADGLDMLYVGYHASRRTATLRYDIGSLVPMGDTAIGRAYLWGLPSQPRQRMVAAMVRQAGPKAASIEAAIAHSFAELETTGTCSVLGTFRRDTVALALPVRVGRLAMPMAMSCGGVVRREDAASECRRIAPMLKAAAPELEALLADLEDFA